MSIGSPVQVSRLWIILGGRQASLTLFLSGLVLLWFSKHSLDNVREAIAGQRDRSFVVQKVRWAMQRSTSQPAIRQVAPPTKPRSLSGSAGCYRVMHELTNTDARSANP